MSYNIEIYTKKNCPYCVRAKNFLLEKSLDFKEIVIDDCVESVYLEMCNRSGGCKTVPQVFINGYHLGGSEDLLKLSNDQLNLFLKKSVFVD